MNLEIELSQYPEKFRKTKIPKAVLDEAKKRVLDTFGCYFGAFDSKPSRTLRQTFLRKDEKGLTQVWGTPHQVNPELAAWINGSGVRTLDYNDTYLSKEPCHPSDLIASLWSACDLSGSKHQGLDLLKGLILGYDVMVRLCDAKSIRKLGWDHVTYLPIASAVANSFILKLNQEQTRHAISLAVTPNNALRQTRVGTISDWKAACASYAARTGLWAARLAQNGFTGPFDSFSGRHGFFKQLSGAFSLSKKPFSKEWKIMSTHTKFFPAEHHSQSAIEAALALRSLIGKKQIEKIIVDIFDVAVDIIGSEKEKWIPTTRETADHSLPYLVAVALLDGKVTLKQYERKRYLNSDVRRLLRVTKVRHDKKFDRIYPKKLPVRLHVKLKGGKTLSETVYLPKGYAGNPMTWTDVQRKFQNLTQKYFSPKQQKALMGQVVGLERISKLSPLLKRLKIAK